MAVEYVYALHDFEPQNDDEIAFVAGERIEVLERDDAYGDGWWTVRFLSFHMHSHRLIKLYVHQNPLPNSPPFARNNLSDIMETKNRAAICPAMKESFQKTIPPRRDLYSPISEPPPANRISILVGMEGHCIR
jgi:hypothetical protein